MLEYAFYQNGQPEKMVIFLHGYNGVITDYQCAIDLLRAKIKNAVIIIPQAPEISDKNPQKYQWFGMLQYDAENKRINPETPVETIFTIYNAASDDVRRCSALINGFIDEMQKKYNIDNEHTYLVGYSQGAMLAISTVLSRRETLAGGFALSGLVAGADWLSENIKSRPQIYLFHGENDLKVQYKTLSYSVQWLKEHGVKPVIRTYPDLKHKVCEEEIGEIAEIINS